MTVLTERFPSLSKHLTVLKESWKEETRTASGRPARSDHEFLPAALEIMEKPPSVAGRALLLILCGSLAVTLLWSFIGRVDVIAAASGKTATAGNSKIVQPSQIGSIRAIHVRDGDFVRKGQLLVELDPTVASAESAQSAQALLDAQLARARNNAVLAYLGGRPPALAAPPGTDPAIVRTQEQLLRSSIAAYESERSSLVEQRAQKAAELVSANAEIAKLRETLPYLDQQVSAREKLVDRGYFSKLKLLEYQQARVEHVRDIDVQQASAAKARAAIRDIDAQLAKLRDTFERNAATELADATSKAETAGEQLRKSDKVRELMELKAPVDGIVQQLAVNTVGGVVQAAQPLMVIVPCNGARADACHSPVEVEASVLNRDVGFVHAGQRVVVKLEAFNFTDYGFIEGRVTNVSRDSVDTANRADPDQPKGSSRAVPPASPVYVARIDLECESPRNESLCRRISPGMAVQAEIRTGSRRVIDYLLSPLSKTVREAARER
jgi:hemolysin D